MRIYELLLMFVRTRLIWDGIDSSDDDDDDDGGRDGSNFKFAPFLEVGGVFRRHDSSVVPSSAGWGWPASAGR